MEICEEWQGTLDAGGYGVVYDPEYGNMRKAHRLAYIEAHGLTLDDIKGQMVLHSCDNRRCVNVEHLRLGSARDNWYDMLERRRHWNNRKTHCDHGHKFDDENTYVYNGNRYCRKCRARQQRERRKRVSNG